MTPPGDAMTPPGDAMTPPGDAMTPPGDAMTPPGDAMTPPGDAMTPPGDAMTPPGAPDPASGDPPRPPSSLPDPAGRPLLRERAGAFRHRNFRLFWGGQLVSLVGTWMQAVAQGWLVLELTDDAFALGLVTAAQFLPVLVLGLFGGVAADAVPKLRGLLITQTASLLLALVLGLLVFSGNVSVDQVLVLALLLGVVNAFDMPIRQSFVIEMVGREDVTSAVGFNSALFNGARIVGPAVAGLLIAAVGLAACFLINAASFLAAIVALLAMRPEELIEHARPDRPRSMRSVVDQLVEGLRYVRATSVILVAVTVLGLVSTFALNFQVLLPLAARDLLAGGPETYGFLAAASGIGSLASALAMAFGRPPTLRLLLVGGAAIGGCVALLGLSSWLPLSLLLMIGAGWGLVAMAATSNTLIQLIAPDELRGRVMSVHTTVFAGSSPIGGLFAGALAASWGVAVALGVGGILALLVVAAASTWVLRHDRLLLDLSASREADRRPVTGVAGRP